jgi:hypothetical protein
MVIASDIYNCYFLELFQIIFSYVLYCTTGTVGTVGTLGTKKHQKSPIKPSKRQFLDLLSILFQAEKHNFGNKTP